MKKAIINICLLLQFFMICVLIPGCQKAPINGNLDGQWEVVEVFPQPVDFIIDERLFYNFNLYVCDLTFFGALFTHGNMRYDEETLWLDFPFIDDEKEKDILTLRQYGILSNPVTFNVEFTDKHHLILSNEASTVVLVKH